MITAAHSGNRSTITSAITAADTNSLSDSGSSHMPVRVVMAPSCRRASHPSSMSDSPPATNTAAAAYDEARVSIRIRTTSTGTNTIRSAEIKFGHPRPSGATRPAMATPGSPSG